MACLVIVGATTAYGLHLETPTGATGSWAFNAGCQATEPIFPIETCLVRGDDTTNTVLLIGDSQAGAISDGVKAATETLGIGFAVWYNDGCPVFPRPTLEREDCDPFLKALPDLISLLNPSVIVVANKSTLYTTGGAQRGGLTIPKQDGQLPKTYSESIEMWLQGLQVQFNKAPFNKKQILLVQQVPTSKPISPTLVNQNQKNYRFNINSDEDRNQLIKDETSSLTKYRNVTLLDPAKTICSNGSCKVTDNGKPVYSDEFHLSPFGALLLKQQLTTALEKMITNSN